MNPADLCRRAVALLVFSRNAEDNSWAVGGRAVDVGVVQLGGVDGARHLGAAVDPDESHLTGTLGAGGAALPHCHIHGILQDAARRRGRGLPCDVDRIVRLHSKKEEEEYKLLSTLTKDFSVLYLSKLTDYSGTSISLHHNPECRIISNRKWIDGWHLDRLNVHFEISHIHFVNLQ